jgi:ubiquinone/menaquinone biosynthesis C-methylase UbiE
VDHEAFKAGDAASYDRVADSYERYIERLAGLLADHLCRLARIEEGAHVLDVGCGTGVATRRAAAFAGSCGGVVGIDLSPGMIAAARRAGSGVEFDVMDAEALTYEDASFDAVISLCAILHFPSPSRAVTDMRRVLRPRGRLALAFGHPRPLTLRGVAMHFLHRARNSRRQLLAPHALREVAAGYFPSPGSEQVVTEWSRRHPARQLKRELVRAGFEDVRTSWLGHEIRFASAEEFADAQLAIDTEVRRRADAVPGSHDAIRAELVRRSEATLARGGSLVYPYSAVFFTGRRSAA